jgi:sugar phosphate permease
MPSSDSPRKLPVSRWVRILPATIIIYVVAYMDRVNIGFAMAGGMNEALHLTMFASGVSAGIFFWGYMVLQVPGGHVAEHGSAKRFIAWSIVACAVVSFVTGFAQNDWQLLFMRFLLGVAESGIYPAILVLIGKWFVRHELGRANGLFLLSLPLSAVLTNPISGAIVSRFSWRGLFFFEGLASLATLLVWIPLIADRPGEASWLPAADRELLLSQLADEKSVQVATAEKQSVSYGRLLVDRNLWIMIALYLSYTAASYGYLFWLPTILKNSTRMTLSKVGWLSAVPLVASVGGVYLFGALSDRNGNRRFYCALALVGFGFWFWLATLFPAHVWVSYALLVIAGLFSKAMQSPCWSMPSVIFPSGLAGGARGIINGIGNLGGFAGLVLMGWFAGRSGNMSASIAGLCAISAAGGAITMLLPKATAGYRFAARAEAAHCVRNR